MKVSVIGASGYAGGELLRLLLNHPSCEIESVTSQRYSEEPVYRVHPNLRGTTSLKFEKNLPDNMKQSEIIFTALPHGKSSDTVSTLIDQGKRIVDLSADFRLKDPSDYETYYGYKHNHPSLLEKSVYGLPELHREEIMSADLVSVPGCMATASILGLAPIITEQLVDPSKIVVDSKIGSSGAGVSPTLASHHAERSEGVRPYKATNHRHIGEISPRDNSRVLQTEHRKEGCLESLQGPLWRRTIRSNGIGQPWPVWASQSKGEPGDQLLRHWLRTGPPRR